MEKERILDEIRRLTRENGGTPPGLGTFLKATGLSNRPFRGGFWRQWSDAVAEAGFAPNKPADAFTADEVVLALINLTRRLTSFPTYADMRLEKQRDDSFPGEQVLRKLGDFTGRVSAVRAYAAKNPEYADVLGYLPADDAPAGQTSGEASDNERSDGHVYMAKHGRYYKIGCTFDVPRRHREIALELPEKLETVHTIRTDDPTGIEAYWHRRFATKRTNGEWFALSRDDVRVFKRRKFM